MISILILLSVFILVAIRQVGKLKLEIWHSMTFGAIACLLTGQITPIDALKSVNLDIILFLFGMFVIGVGLEESGYLCHIFLLIFSKMQKTIMS